MSERSGFDRCGGGSGGQGDGANIVDRSQTRHNGGEISSDGKHFVVGVELRTAANIRVEKVEPAREENPTPAKKQ